MTEIPSDWYDGYFEEEWLDEIALHIPEERTRKEVDFVLDRLELEPGARVLDVACGHGRHSLELARRGFVVTGIDLSPRSTSTTSRRFFMRRFSRARRRGAGRDTARRATPKGQSPRHGAPSHAQGTVPEIG